MAQARWDYLKKFNTFLNRLSTPLNIINMVVGFLMGIAHAYIPLPSIGGLLLGIAMACSSSVSMGVNYYFTSVNTRNELETQQQPERLQATRKSKTFLVLCIPMILLNSAGSFFCMYTGIPLLMLALGLPAGPALMAVTVVLGSILALGTLINSWLQVHHLAETLKTEVSTIEDSECENESQKKDQTEAFRNEQKLDNIPAPGVVRRRMSDPGVRPPCVFFASSLPASQPRAIDATKRKVAPNPRG